MRYFLCFRWGFLASAADYEEKAEDDRQDHQENEEFWEKGLIFSKNSGDVAEGDVALSSTHVRRQLLSRLRALGLHRALRVREDFHSFFLQVEYDVSIHHPVRSKQKSIQLFDTQTNLLIFQTSKKEVFIGLPLDLRSVNIDIDWGEYFSNSLPDGLVVVRLNSEASSTASFGD